MNKKEFLVALENGLGELPQDEQNKWADFYSEMIDDRMEEGLEEGAAVAAIGSVEAVVAQILAQAKPETYPKKKREQKTWQTVLLIVGSPLWFSLLIVAASVVFSLFVTAWALVISFYAVAAALLACGLAGVFLLVLLWVKGNAVAGFFALGAGLACAGLGIFGLIGTRYMNKGVFWLSKKLFAALKPGKEAAQ